MNTCEKCNQNTSNFAAIIKVNGVTQEKKFLCEECALELQEQLENMAEAGEFSGMDQLDEPTVSMLKDVLEDAIRKGGSQMKQPTIKTKKGLLEQVGTDITELAKEGKLFPLSGREKEVEAIIDILNRLTKNNGILIGEPGVGKTAIVEGLAQRILAGDVPSKMQDKRIISLDIPSLVAGTGIRGQFEEKVGALIKEAASRKDIILFIDEMHMIMGAGDPAGKMDVGNMLKPAMARGDIQVIGATTLKEYRQIEKDAALERRLQPILVEEPTKEETKQILEKLKERFEAYHGVTYSDKAIETCVELADKYIHDRFMPDKAIDLMDIAGSKLNLLLTNDPLGKMRRELITVTEEKERAILIEEFEDAANLRAKENRMIEEITNRQTVLQAQGQGIPSVPEELIAKIIEEKTGIKAAKLTETEQEKVNLLETRLSDRVIGQLEAIKAVSRSVRRNRVGLNPQGKPVGSFLFVGPSGVGKTELARKLAEELFGEEESMIRLDMSEYMEKHAVSKLIGSPPGYVGFDDGGQLTDRVRRKPYSVILLDEIEKAHPDVVNIFLQILEDGRLTDSHGKQVSFANTMIIATSNAGATQKKANALGFGEQTPSDDRDQLLDTLKAYFRPELLNRFDEIISFNRLETTDLVKIVDLTLHDVAEALHQQQGLTLSVTRQAKINLAEKGYKPEFGARELNRTIQKYLVDPITDKLLENFDGEPVTSIQVSGTKDGKFTFKLQ